MNSPGSRWLAVVAAVALCAGAGAAAQEDDVAPAPHYSSRGADTCLMCHRDQTTAAVFQSVHGQPDSDRGPFGPGQLQCEACHGPGGAHAGPVKKGTERAALLRFVESESAADRSAPCLECHTGNAAIDWHSGTHKAEGLACNDCHVSHAAENPATSPSGSDQVCATCHRSQALAVQKPFSHKPVAGQPGCLSCHSAHGGANESGLREETTNATCYGCHPDTRGPFLWEHPPVVEDCAACHNPHGSNQPGMLVRRGPFLCQSCHAQAGHPSVAPTPVAPGDGGAALRLLNNCSNCHSQVHGSNHPSGRALTR